MGRVLRATDTRLGRTVAIKEALAPAGACRSTSFERLEREARIASRLTHPGIVSVHDAGRWQSGTPYYSMELIRGRSLADAIADAATADARLALLPHVIAVADALAYAHSERIIHRDIKPHNVIVGHFGETVLIDWGLAKDLADASPDDGPGGPYREASEIDPALTVGGQAVGTPAYMAPEQAAAERVDERADVYALGALLYHVLAGQPPFARSKLSAVLAGPPRRLAHAAPNAPGELVAIVDKAMARQPAQRYRTAGAMAEDLRRFATGRLVSVHHYGAWGTVRHWLRTRRVSATVAVGLTVVLVVVAVVSVHRIVAANADLARSAEALTARNEQLTLASAREVLDRDPTAAVDLLRSIDVSGPSFEAARAIALDARARGVARHVVEAHADRVSQVASSPDGRFVATGDKAGRVLVYRVADGAVFEALPTTGDEVYELGFSADGERLAIGGEFGLAQWTAADARTVNVPGHAGAVFTAAYASNGDLVSAGADNAVRRTSPDGSGRTVYAADPAAERIYTLHSRARDVTIGVLYRGGLVALGADGTVLWTRDHPGGGAAFSTVSPSGNLFGSVGRDGHVRVWDVATGTMRDLGAHPDGVRIAFSADDRFVASTSRTVTIRVWDLEAATDRVLAGHTLDVYWVAFGDDPRTLASAGRDGTVRVWDVVDGERWVLRGHRGEVRRVAFAGDALVSISDDHTARIWHPEGRDIRVVRAHDASIYNVAFDATGARVVTSALDGTVKVWDATTWEATTLPGHARGVWRMVVGGAGAIITSDGLRACRAWDVHRREARVLGERGACARGASVAPDGRTVTGLDAGGGVQRFDLVGGAAPETIVDGGAIAAADTGDSVYVALATGDVFRWRAGTVASIGSLGERAHIATERAGVLVVAGATRAKAWQLHDDTSVDVFHPSVRITGMALSPDGARVSLWAVDRVVYVADLATGEHRALRGHQTQVRAAAFSPDGDSLASASNGELYLWSVGDGERRALHGHAQWVNDLAFSSDGKQLATVGPDRTMRLWSAELAAPTPADAVELRRLLDELTTAHARQGEALRTQPRGASQ